jgi:hypothetical protein
MSFISASETNFCVRRQWVVGEGRGLCQTRLSSGYHRRRRIHPLLESPGRRDRSCSNCFRRRGNGVLYFFPLRARLCCRVRNDVDHPSVVPLMG